MSASSLDRTLAQSVSASLAQSRTLVLTKGCVHRQLRSPTNGIATPLPRYILPNHQAQLHAPALGAACLPVLPYSHYTYGHSLHTPTPTSVYVLVQGIRQHSPPRVCRPPELSSPELDAPTVPHAHARPGPASPVTSTVRLSYLPTPYVHAYICANTIQNLSNHLPSLKTELDVRIRSR